jgi:hypothetical protein
MDVIRGVTLDPASFHKGDLRLVALSKNIPADCWKSEYVPDGTERNFWISTFITGNSGKVARLDSTTIYDDWLEKRVGAPAMTGMQRCGVDNVGDFMNGIGPINLGGFLMSSDMGFTPRTTSSDVPYFSNLEMGDARAEFNNLVYSPTRMVPSPIILGQVSAYASDSIPNPWETLLFCRNPHGGTGTGLPLRHMGWADPKDHYLLDLFNMPVVEPYAISQPLTTQGQINLNQTIAPFIYIDRTTGLHAALKNVRLYAFTDKKGIKNKTRSIIKTKQFKKQERRRYYIMSR